MPELLLDEARTPATDEAQVANRHAGWVRRLHDVLDAAGGNAVTTDIDRMTSWLRVQAVGRSEVRVTDPRVTAYAGQWALAASRAGYTGTRLRTETGQTTSVTPAPVPAAPNAAVADAVPMADGWADRARGWLSDRTESAGRRLIRTLSR